MGFSEIEFFKYEGTGNDFIVIDNRDQIFPTANLDLVRKMCDRKFGIGSDGLLLLQDHDNEDVEYLFYNPDGSSSFCGNGSRCATHFARELGIGGDSVKFIGFDGAHEGQFVDNQIKISMADAREVEVNDGYEYVYTGSPHVIVYVNDVEAIDIIPEAHKIRYSDAFADQGVNVNFAELHSSYISMRTYERGVEDETLSCGTGVTAAALCSARGKSGPQTVNVKTRGGDLVVDCNVNDDGSFSSVWLQGPVSQVYKGIYKIPS